MTLHLRFGLLIVSLLAIPVVGTSLVAQTSAPVPTRAVQTELSDKELMSLLENAKSPAEHERLAAFYDAEAKDFEAKAARHKQLAAVYRRMPASGNPRIQAPPSMAPHCESVASEAEKAAKEARTMADHHRMVAKER